MTETTAYAPTISLQRLGVVMRGDDTNPDEAWGVLNPATARSQSGELFLFPRIVADGNLSRIGIARVLFDDEGIPRGVERLGYALEPDMWYERNPRTAGCEDPRITFIPALGLYVMAYSAYGPRSSRVALATSPNLMDWTRLGLVKFADERGIDWNIFDNKDAFFFPEPVAAPDGRLSLAFAHRPTFQISWLTGGMSGTGEDTIAVLPENWTEERPGIWISYCPLDTLESAAANLVQMEQHTPVAFSEHDWEALKIGGGTQPVQLNNGNYLTMFHGVSGRIVAGQDHQSGVHYSAGYMVHDHDDPTKVVYRSAEPVLTPELAEEREGIVGNVVFPTALDDHGNGTVDVYYGMADARIGVARLTIQP